jgi:glycosyltransferase involved in cell wall biosynthesis
MNMVFISNTVPFPPRDGRELPLARQIEHFSRFGAVDLIVMGKDAQHEVNTRAMNASPGVRRVIAIQARRPARFTAALQELLVYRPSFFYTAFNEAEVLEAFASEYDIAWISPVGCWGITRYCNSRGIRIARKIVLGLNDLKTTLYFDSAQQFFFGRGLISATRLLRPLRSPLIALLERKYIRQADVVHVQTEREMRRANLLLVGNRSRPIVVAAPNGRSSSPGVYRNVDANRVLYVTNLRGGRARESDWFLQKVWPAVVKRLPAATLWLAGSPPLDSTRRLGQNVEHQGFITDFDPLFANVSVVVVPTFYTTGVNNRLLEALAAATPVVTTPQALATVRGSRTGVHALTAASPGSFSQHVVNLLENPGLRRQLSDSARAIALQQPTWNESLTRIQRAVGL